MNKKLCKVMPPIVERYLFGTRVYSENEVIEMFTELKKEIEECVDGGEGSPQFEQGVDIARCQVVDIIQEKINALKGEENDLVVDYRLYTTMYS